MNRRIFAGIVLFALLCAMLTGCGGREKVDLNGAASLADLRGATLGAQTGTFHLQALEQVESVTKKDYADFTDLLNALRSGAIDGYVAEEPTALEVCGKETRSPISPSATMKTASRPRTRRPALPPRSVPART